VIGQEEALDKILKSVGPLPSRVLPLARSVGCFAARDFIATLSLPPFDNSAMDGYAVIAASCARGGQLRIVDEQPAGIDRNLLVRPGEAVRILTGAPLPAGADAVIMQEDVTLQGNSIVLNERVVAGEFVRRRGGDVAAGQKVISAGDRIPPQVTALLAAQGLDSFEVGGDVRAAIISTGDELVPPGFPLQPGQIYDSNSFLLQALLEQSGVNVVSVTHCADRSREIESAIRAGTECDVLIITGGVSVGARDLVKDALATAGATIELWRVAVKPGKPFLFGRVGECAIFALPGNPVSAFVTFLLFVRPALLRLMGANDAALSMTRCAARLTTDVYNDSERPHYVRGRNSNGKFSPVGRQESHALYGLARSNAMLMVKPGDRLTAGSEIDVLIWD
jgi:molybdopterin molybdotransferase